VVVCLISIHSIEADTQLALAAERSVPVRERVNRQCMRAVGAQTARPELVAAVRALQSRLAAHMARTGVVRVRVRVLTEGGAQSQRQPCAPNSRRSCTRWHCT
jgi:hypothetical protein